MGTNSYLGCLKLGTGTGGESLEVSLFGLFFLSGFINGGVEGGNV